MKISTPLTNLEKADVAANYRNISKDYGITQKMLASIGSAGTLESIYLNLQKHKQAGKPLINHSIAKRSTPLEIIASLAGEPRYAFSENSPEIEFQDAYFTAIGAGFNRDGVGNLQTSEPRSHPIPHVSGSYRKRLLSEETGIPEGDMELYLEYVKLPPAKVEFIPGRSAQPWSQTRVRELAKGIKDLIQEAYEKNKDIPEAPKRFLKKKDTKLGEQYQIPL